MKKLLKVMVVVLAVAMVSACFTATTLSKYKTAIGTGTSTAKVARWGFTESSVTVDLFSSAIFAADGKSVGSSAANNIVAPGAIGSTSVKFTAPTNAPEVNYQVKWTVSTAITDGDLMSALKFKVNDGEWKALDSKQIVSSATVSKFAGEAPEDVELTIWWKWDDTDNDTALGNASTLADVKVGVSIEAEQVNVAVKNTAHDKSDDE